MKTTQGISLYSYFCIKLAKYHVFLIIFYVFSSTKLENRRAEGGVRGRMAPGGGIGGTNNIYTCKQMQKGYQLKLFQESGEGR
jgi:hypothetical protein